MARELVLKSVVRVDMSRVKTKLKYVPKRQEKRRGEGFDWYDSNRIE